jgi:ribosome-binding protein aMBF1 (putative translation factor)
MNKRTAPAVPSQPEPKRRVPPRVRDAINELVYGRAKTITAAAEKVGLSRERLSRALSEPHVADYLRTRAARVVGLASGSATGVTD